QVEVAANGKIALDALQQRTFDLLLTDVQMPEMDGFELTAAVRQEEKEGQRLPIVAMTAHAMKGDRERCLKTGMDGYIAKPIQASELVQMIEHLFSSAEPEARSAELPTSSALLAPSSALEVLDPAGALKRVEGSREMLKILVEMFFEEGPKQLAAV